MILAVLTFALGATNLSAGPASPSAGATQFYQIEASIRGSVEASLARLDRSSGPALAAQVARLLRWRGDIIRDVHPADRIEVVYTKASKAEGGPILQALSYEGAAIKIRAYLHADSSGILRYYDEGGALIEPVLRNSPTQYIQITETVQHGRGKRRHGGIDLKANEGTPIALPYAATVYRINWSTRVNGLCVEVKYTEGPARGNVARFLHLASIDGGLKKGQRYAANTPVGEVGNTGRSSAAHLHYEVRSSKGKALSPLKIHGSSAGKLAADAMARFSAHRMAMDLRLRDAGVTL